MSKDITLINGNVINISDMIEFIYNNKPKEKQISIGSIDKTLTRYTVLIPVDDIKNILNNKGITKDSLNHKLNSYINNHMTELNNSGNFFDDLSVNKRKDFYNKYKSINHWKDALRKVTESKIKPDNEYFFFSDYEYEDYLFNKNSENSEIIDDIMSFMLKKNLDIIFEFLYTDSLYYIPFLNDNEILYLALLAYEDVTEIEIDITERHNSHIEKIKDNIKISNRTLHLTRLENEAKEVQKKFSSYNDAMIRSLLLTHLISMFETYISGITLIAVNNSDIYLKNLVEKDTRFANGRKIQYNEIFQSFSKLRSEVNKFISENSFQNIDIAKKYIEEIFAAELTNESFYKMYAHLINLRHKFVHNCGYEKDGTRIQLEMDENKFQQYIRILLEVANAIDKKVIININSI